MLGLTFAQMRRSVGRLAAAGIAIVIGTAFVAATLLATDVFKRAGYDSITAGFGKAELVVKQGDEAWGASAITLEHLDAIRHLDGVEAADATVTTTAYLTHGKRTIQQVAIGARTSSDLQPLTLTEGTLPRAVGEIALPADSARLLGVGLGDVVVEQVNVYPDVEVWVDSTDATAPTTEEGAPDETASADLAVDLVDEVEQTFEVQTIERPLTIVGITEDPYDAFALSSGAAIRSNVDFDQSLRETYSGSEAYLYDVAILLAPGADLDQVRDAAQAVVDSAGLTVMPKDEAAAQAVDSLTEGQAVFTTAILAFAAVALVVAALVISNTFQVLVAQRTRTLALLRCVGADKAQLRRSVVIEAAALGLIASVAGFVLGAVLVQVAVMVLGRMQTQMPIPRTVTPTLASVLWPLLVGVLVTVVASLFPARAATRVSPLEALRPAEAVGREAASQARRWAATLLGLGGGALMVLALLIGHEGQFAEALATGLLGGALSFTGVLLSAVFWVPSVVAALGGLLSRTGPSARLATANTSRNPRRTAATSTALLIGVTLVAMMSVAAATARSSMDSKLDELYTIDVMATVSAWPESGGSQSLPEGTIDKIEAVGGVDTIAPVTVVIASIENLSSPAAPEPDDPYEAPADAPTSTGSTSDDRAFLDEVSAAEVNRLEISAVQPEEARAVMRGPDALPVLDDDALLMTANTALWNNITEGDAVQLTGADGEVVLFVVLDQTLYDGQMVVTAANGTALSDQAEATQAWIRLSDDARASSTVADIREAVSQTDASVSGAAVQRTSREQLVDTILAIIVGLLAIAVVIAVIGVANTLSLSVLERRRESATLRAIGLSRRQLRTTLAIEGMVIAGVGALVGVVLGIVYGWYGSYLILETFSSVSLTIPWRDMALVMGTAVLAGFLASVLPARTAVRTSPVEALAND